MISWFVAILVHISFSSLDFSFHFVFLVVDLICFNWCSSNSIAFSMIFSYLDFEIVSLSVRRFLGNANFLLKFAF